QERRSAGQSKPSSPLHGLRPTGRRCACVPPTTPPGHESAPHAPARSTPPVQSNSGSVSGLPWRECLPHTRAKMTAKIGTSVPRPISTADKQLLDALAAAGFPDAQKRPAQWKRRLEDWRHDELYQPADKTFPGAGGSNAEYPEQTVTQVIQLAQLMQERAR